MKRFLFSTLFAVGIAEIVIGVLVGRVRIYGYVLPFFRDLGLSPSQSPTFNHYIRIYQDQWHLVAWLGVITLITTALLFWCWKKEKAANLTPRSRAQAS